MGNRLCMHRPDILPSFLTSPQGPEVVVKEVKQPETTPVEENSLKNYSAADQQLAAKLVRLRKSKIDNRMMVERIRVLEENMSSLGKLISVEELKQRTSPAILRVASTLEDYKGSPAENADLEKDLIYRRPFLYNFDNSIYYGFWNHKGLREGYGVTIEKDGLKLEGIWREGKLTKGRIFEVSGNYYEGEMEEGEALGAGKKVMPSGDVFTGNWKNGKQHLNGERVFADQCKYTGLFDDDLFNGKGKLTWTDGSLYEGEFTKSTLNGNGKLKHPNGESYVGGWLNNLPNGEGAYTFKGQNLGQKFEGHYVNGIKQGEGIFTFKNNVFYSGSWKNNVPHGCGEYKMNGIVYKGFWRYGNFIHHEDPKTSSKGVPNLDILKVEKEKIKQKSELLHVAVDDGKKNIPVQIYRVNTGAELLVKN